MLYFQTKESWFCRHHKPTRTGSLSINQALPCAGKSATCNSLTINHIITSIYIICDIVLAQYFCNSCIFLSESSTYSFAQFFKSAAKYFGFQRPGWNWCDKNQPGTQCERPGIENIIRDTMSLVNPQGASHRTQWKSTKDWKSGRDLLWTCELVET